LSIQQTIITMTEMMAAAAVTAPKARGDNVIGYRILHGEQLQEFGRQMIEYGKESQRKNYDRDGNNVLNSDALLIIFLNGEHRASLNCGACGYDTCAEFHLRQGPEFDGPVCAIRSIDLGTAVGSAVKMASILNIDNRVMYRVGPVARKYGWIDGPLAVGIPVSITAKNIFFDRG
jgi:uncharacterized ferredoxin-like protein